MKSTEERFDNVYCRPTDEEFEAMFDGIKQLGQEYVYWNEQHGLHAHHCIESVNDKEIPVPRFIDLLHDRIAPWRLEEDGFTKRGSWYIFDTIVGEFCIDRDGGVHSVETQEQADVNTYTDLITLIKLIG